jgi:hypothetical protein
MIISKINAENIFDINWNFRNIGLGMNYSSENDDSLGPFVSMNYVYVNTATRININEYIFSGGLHFSYKLKDNKYFKYYNSQIINTEIGYRNIMGMNKFYFSINVDIILALIGIGSKMEYNQKYSNNKFIVISD